MNCFLRFLRVLFVVFVCLHSFAATAQSTPRVEIFTGYSYLHGGDIDDGIVMHGFNIELIYKVDRRLGIVGDLSMHFADRRNVNLRRTLYLFGPEATIPTRSKAKVFIHVLLGGANHHYSVGSVEGNSNSFALAAGGGVDLDLSNRNVAFRLIQADYVMTTFGNGTQNHFRLSTGFVFRL